MGTALVQSKEQILSKGNTLNVVLAGAPSSGNLLVLGLAFSPSAVSTVSNSMTEAITEELSSVYTAIYYKLCDGTESATTSIVFTSNSVGYGFLAEFSGVEELTGVASDKAASGTSLTTGAVGDGNTLLDFAIWCVNSASATFSSPTPTGMAIIDQGNGNISYGATYELDRLASASPGIVSSVSTTWSGSAAAFQLPAAGLPMPVALSHMKKMRSP